MRRICSKKDFVTNARRMAGYFLKADYPADIIQKGFSKAFHTHRHSLGAVPAKPTILFTTLLARSARSNLLATINTP